MSIASEAKQSYSLYLLDFIRLLRLCAPRNDATPDFLRDHQFRVLKKWRDRLCCGPGDRSERAGSIGWVAPWPGA